MPSFEERLHTGPKSRICLEDGAAVAQVLTWQKYT
jgi:hypothetical protein